MTIRREQVREAIDRHRKRRKHGLLWRPILVTKRQLDQLEERGYPPPPVIDHARPVIDHGERKKQEFIAD